MVNIKTKDVNRAVVEHLINNMGVTTEYPEYQMLDSPYLFVVDDKIILSNSRGYYRATTEVKELNQNQILKLLPEVKKDKNISPSEKLAMSLVKHLNNSNNNSVSGYPVIFAYVEAEGWLGGSYNVLPISPHACGSITFETMKLIMDFITKAAPVMEPSFSYTNYNGEKERFGTYTPCIRIK